MSEDKSDTDVAAAKEEFPYIAVMQSVVAQHGECHAILEEHDSFDHGKELEVRQGTATFDYESETLVVEGADTEHYVHMDRVVRFFPPREVSH